MVDHNNKILLEIVGETKALIDAVEPKMNLWLEQVRKNQSADPIIIKSISSLLYSIYESFKSYKFSQLTQLAATANSVLDTIELSQMDVVSNDVTTFKQVFTLLKKILADIKKTQSDQKNEEQVEKLINQLKEIKDRHVLIEGPEEVKQVGDDGDESQPEVYLPVTQDLIDKFVSETDGMFEQFDQIMIDLESNADEELIAQAQRGIHSFKGNCGFMGLIDLEKLSHKMETVLSALHEGELLPNTEIINVLLKMKDVLQDTLNDYANGGSNIIAELEDKLALLEELFENNSIMDTDSADEDVSQTVTMEEKILRRNKNIMQHMIRQDIRVDLKKLDLLINLVGELVTAETMLTQHPLVKNLRDEDVEKSTHQLRRISQDLQDVAMAVRMIPLTSTFQKIVRLVYDLGDRSQKKIELQLIGEETEVDKTVIEKIADPLVHIIRNAIDHGIESAEERLAANKAVKGKITIEGRNEGGEVWIIVHDDGRGLNREKIIKRAQNMGILNNDGSDLTNGQVYKYIFEPGFSTADKITNISGRGIGMDVVKKNIEKLKGRIDIQSQPGLGTSFILRIPLTLSIIEGMLVRLGEARYTIPILVIKESFQPKRHQITITPDGNELVKVRDEIFPVIRLHQVFMQHTDVTELEKGILVIVDLDGQRACLFTDSIIGQQETVVKPLSEYVSKARGISGCTILGDGEVSLIIDVGELFDIATINQRI